MSKRAHSKICRTHYSTTLQCRLKTSAAGTNKWRRRSGTRGGESPKKGDGRTTGREGRARVRITITFGTSPRFPPLFNEICSQPANRPTTAIRPIRNELSAASSLPASPISQFLTLSLLWLLPLPVSHLLPRFSAPGNTINPESREYYRGRRPIRSRPRCSRGAWLGCRMWSETAKKN